MDSIADNLTRAGFVETRFDDAGWRLPFALELLALQRLTVAAFGTERICPLTYQPGIDPSRCAAP
ncbi:MULTISPECIES: hypothetical protein [Catellatospora]|uniref:Uncharacterized protein n=1 Tax=Catellatospora chokoriensis TaxID=310353 RepID=A0A8J3NW13_9ACTN|nr:MULTISPECIES: hypothetical protein [Catellatospora]GIF94645.1 hypothetical protein Cch02nite_80890 [Catellatospora chokoriensis]